MARSRRRHPCCIPCKILIADPIRSVRFNLRERFRKPEPPKTYFLEEDPLPPLQNRVKAAVKVVRKERPRWRSDREHLDNVIVNSQPGSLFLTHLPLEIRHRIYLELWREAGLEQHIVRREGRHVRLGCLVDQYSAIDNRQSRIRSEQFVNRLGISCVRYLDSQIWNRRLCSPWSNHWPCEEHALALWTDASNVHATEAWAPWMPLMRTCRKLYPEVRDSMYHETAFVFTSLSTAYDFLVNNPSPCTIEIRRLHFSIVLPTPLADPEKVDEPWIKAKLWFAISRKLRTLPNLHHLHLWFEALDYKYRDLLLQESQILEPLWRQPLSASITVNLPADEAHPIDQDLAMRLREAGVSVVERGYPTCFVDHDIEYPWGRMSTTPWSFEEARLEARIRSEATIDLA